MTFFQRLLLSLSFIISPSILLANSVSIETAELAKILNQDDLVIVDMSRDHKQYQRFHIPHAIYIPYHQFKNKQGKAISQEKLTALLGGYGINQDNQVVVYDSMGGLHAGRLLWALEHIGHPKVAVLNGGMVKWVLENNKVSSQAEIRPSTVYKKNNPTRDNLASAANIQKAIDNKELILDVRSSQEYIGHPNKNNKQHAPKNHRSGHIPSAKLWTWNEHVDFKNGTVLKPAKDLRDHLEILGLKKNDQPVYVYCKSGHRASQAYYTLRALGYDNVRLYDGSMDEWAKLKNTKLTRGYTP